MIRRETVSISRPPMVTIKVIAVMALWSACFPLITVGLDLAPHITFAAMRALIAGVALVGVAKTLGRPVPAGRTTWLLLIVAGVGATTLGFLGMFHAAEYIAPGMATVIANTQPLLAAALAYLVLNERFGTAGIVGLAVGLGGIAVIAAPGFSAQQSNDHYLLGIGFVLLAAAGITISNVAFKYLAGTVDPLMAAGTQLLIGTIPLSLIAALTETPSDVTWSPTFVLILLGLALPGTAVAYWLWLSALETLPLTRANAFSFLVPIFGLTIGIAFYGEVLTISIAVGASLALIGITLVTRATGTERTALDDTAEPAALETTAAS
ncbi:DMT family transporter [Ilumatobacter sp.]|uniref:DMT family transporter n=1 Tax=Ilumatobacter sp. TaxID=1967498 RepID=UPI003752BF07